MRAVHFGAGNIGRGFIGEVLAANGFSIDFVDINDVLIDALCARGEYEIELAGVARSRSRVRVQGVSGINSKKDPQAVTEAIVRADLITTAIGPSVLPLIAPLIADGIRARRKANNETPIDVIACENMLQGSAFLGAEVAKCLKGGDAVFAGEFVGFPNAAVDRIVPLQRHDDPLFVLVEDFKEWVVEDEARKAPNITLKGVHYAYDLEPFVERKLFSVNTAHATCAYAGFFRGHSSIQEALNDWYVRTLVERVLAETSFLLVAKWGFGERVHRVYVEQVLERLNNPALDDTIARVARGPLRKLGFNERFIQPMRELHAMGRPYSYLGLAAAHIFLYEAPGDPESDRIHSVLAQLTPAESVQLLTGLGKSPLIGEIALAYKALQMLAPGAAELPVDVSKKDLNCDLSTNFDHRPLTLRHPKQRAVFRIASVICNGFGNFLEGAGFTRICSPKIVREGAEGGANLFKLNYFDRDAYLAQSPQFYKQMMVGVFGRVYEEAPVFRAEEHNTSRHLNEYLSLDLEMILENGFEDIIQTEAAMLRSVFARLGERCGPELEALGAALPALDRIITLKFREAHEIVLAGTGRDCRAEADLDPEEERVISEYVKKHWGSDFVFVTHYPSSKRPFYALDDPESPGETLSFDLIFRGVEITTGGARMYRYEDYLDKMKRRNMNIAAFESYLQTFRFGIPPHGGLGLGLERLTAQLCGLANVKEASLFPRDRKRVEP